MLTRITPLFLKNAIESGASWDVEPACRTIVRDRNYKIILRIATVLLSSAYTDSLIGNKNLLYQIGHNRTTGCDVSTEERCFACRLVRYAA